MIRSVLVLLAHTWTRVRERREQRAARRRPAGRRRSKHT